MKHPQSQPAAPRPPRANSSDQPCFVPVSWMLPDHQHNQRDCPVLASTWHENAQPRCCIHHRYTARKIQGISPNCGVGKSDFITRKQNGTSAAHHRFCNTVSPSGRKPWGCGGRILCPLPHQGPRLRRRLSRRTSVIQADAHKGEMKRFPRPRV